MFIFRSVLCIHFHDKNLFFVTFWKHFLSGGTRKVVNLLYRNKKKINKIKRKTQLYTTVRYHYSWGSVKTRNTNSYNVTISNKNNDGSCVAEYFVWGYEAKIIIIKIISVWANWSWHVSRKTGECPGAMYKIMVKTLPHCGFTVIQYIMYIRGQNRERNKKKKINEKRNVFSIIII